MRSHIILHIPHSSLVIPDRYRSRFYLQGEDLLREQLCMTTPSPQAPGFSHVVKGNRTDCCYLAFPVV